MRNAALRPASADGRCTSFGLAWLIIFLALGHLATAASASSFDVVINEVSGRGSSGTCHEKPWVELHNRGAADIDLSGMQLQHTHGDTTHMTFGSRMIKARAYLVHCYPDEPSTGPPPPPGSSQMKLLNTLGHVVSDTGDFLHFLGDVTWSRLENGAYTDLPATPGAANEITPTALDSIYLRKGTNADSFGNFSDPHERSNPLSQSARLLQYNGGCDNIKLKILLAIGVGDSIKAGVVSSEAEKVAKESCFKGSTNGEQDAFRHIYWQCRLTQRIGAGKAKKVGDINEECGGNNDATKEMDYHNNQVGRDLEQNEPGCNCKTRAEEQIHLGFAMVIDSVPSSCQKKDYITYKDQVYIYTRGRWLPGDNYMEGRWLSGGRTIERNGFGTSRPNIGVMTRNLNTEWDTVPKDFYQWTIQSADAWSNTHSYPQAGRCLKYGDTISLQNNGRLLGDASFGGNHGDNRLDNRLFPGEFLSNNQDLSTYDSARLLSKSSKYGFYVQSWGVGILQIEQNKWSWAIKLPRNCSHDKIEYRSENNNLDRDREHREYITHNCTAGVSFGINGDLVILSRNFIGKGTHIVRKFWRSNTQNRGASQMVLEDDGNMVIYGSNSKVLWKSGKNTVGRSLTASLRKRSDPYIPLPISYWHNAQKIFGPYVYAVDILNDPPPEYFEKPDFSKAYLWTVKSVLHSGSHYTSSQPDPATGRCLRYGVDNEVYLQSNNCHVYPSKKGSATFCPWLSGNHKSYNRQNEGVGTYYYVKDDHWEKPNMGVEEVQWWQIHDEELRYKWTLRKEVKVGSCDTGNNRELKILSAIGLIASIKAAVVSSEAEKVAKKSCFKGSSNGEQDAFRHIYWQCRLTQRIGAGKAKRVGYINVECGGNNDKEKAMDYHNNQVGRDLEQNEPGCNCKTRAEEQIHLGFAMVIDSVPSSCEKAPSVAPTTPDIICLTNTLNTAVSSWHKNKEYTEWKYGLIGDWDVSRCTAFFRTFYWSSKFNSDVANWDVSQSLTFRNMFHKASAFNGNLSSWDVSKSLSFRDMFNDASVFDSDLSNWDVSKSTSFRTMFYKASAFDGGLSRWDVSKSLSFQNMFNHAFVFNNDLSNWDVSKSSSFRTMFYKASTFNGDLSSWDVSKSLSFQDMFNHASVFNNDLSNWDVSKSSSFRTMFYKASAFNGDLSSWDVSKSISFSDMFNRASVFDSDLSSWDVSKSSSFRNMFREALAFNGDLSSWDVSKSLSFSNMFNRASVFDSDLSNWDVSKSSSFRNMFREALAFNGDLSSWDISKSTTFSNMFKHASVFNRDLSSWDVSKARSFNRMFQKALAFNVDLSSWDVSASTDFVAMFSFASAFNQALCWNVLPTSKKGRMFQGLVGAKLDPYPDCISG